jgi:hypothetical protein
MLLPLDDDSPPEITRGLVQVVVKTVLADRRATDPLPPHVLPPGTLPLQVALMPSHVEVSGKKTRSYPSMQEWFWPDGYKPVSLWDLKPTTAPTGQDEAASS